MNDSRSAAVAIVGGGPAGAALAILLAERAIATVLFERLAAPRWRASGVYSSPLTRRRLAGLGLAPGEVERLVRPIGAMVLRTEDGSASCRLEYPAPMNACGLDRVRLERVLLDRARQAGAEVLEGAPVRAVDLGGERPHIHASVSGSAAAWSAQLVVGADGPTSIVARAAGVALATRHFRRAGITGHRADPAAAAEGLAMDAEMILGAGWYLGIAPVPGGRVNLGLVVSETELRAGAHGAGSAARLLEARAASLAGGRWRWASASATDPVRVALPLAHRVSRSAGRRFLLVGDACGFIDPLSGDGLQRAFATASRAADAIAAWSAGAVGALSDYDRHVRARFRSKDVLSWFLQGFLANPPLTAHAVRRLDRRPELSRVFAGALADLRPASEVLDPRFIGRLMLP